MEALEQLARRRRMRWVPDARTTRGNGVVVASFVQRDSFFQHVWPFLLLLFLLLLLLAQLLFYFDVELYQSAQPSTRSLGRAKRMRSRQNRQKYSWLKGCERKGWKRKEINQKRDFDSHSYYSSRERVCVWIAYMLNFIIIQ